MKVVLKFDDVDDFKFREDFEEGEQIVMIVFDVGCCIQKFRKLVFMIQLKGIL